ncbi:hypothetical protein SASPL_133698 [Salvia splendens]|uniref:Uncharacterized protein n=1 Tax=Salvia splendens TaxID=180675 RepID=A0A8X8X367_SALSN|nr:hypothetical protein SASPL_133698 [Salvia splendens]
MCIPFEALSLMNFVMMETERNCCVNCAEMPLDKGNEAKLIKQVQSAEKANKSGELIKRSNQAVRQGPLASRRRAREEMSWM